MLVRNDNYQVQATLFLTKPLENSPRGYLVLDTSWDNQWIIIWSLVSFLRSHVRAFRNFPNFTSSLTLDPKTSRNALRPQVRFSRSKNRFSKLHVWSFRPNVRSLRLSQMLQTSRQICHSSHKWKISIFCVLN